MNHRKTTETSVPPQIEVGRRVMWLGECDTGRFGKIVGVRSSSLEVVWGDDNEEFYELFWDARNIDWVLLPEVGGTVEIYDSETGWTLEEVAITFPAAFICNSGRDMVARYHNQHAALRAEGYHTRWRWPEEAPWTEVSQHTYSDKVHPLTNAELCTPATAKEIHQNLSKLAARPQFVTPDYIASDAEKRRLRGLDPLPPNLPQPQGLAFDTTIEETYDGRFIQAKVTPTQICKHALPQRIERVEPVEYLEVCLPSDHPEIGYDILDNIPRETTVRRKLIKQAQRVLAEIPSCPFTGEQLEYDFEIIGDQIAIGLYCPTCTEKMFEKKGGP